LTGKPLIALPEGKAARIAPSVAQDIHMFRLAILRLGTHVLAMGKLLPIVSPFVVFGVVGSMASNSWDHARHVGAPWNAPEMARAVFKSASASATYTPINLSILHVDTLEPLERFTF
jgi:hypothetical protein